MDWDGRDNPLRKSFGERAREQRRVLGMTQEQLATESGLDATYISAIERGLRNPSLDVIARLSVALRIPAWKLLKPFSEGCG